MAKIFLSTLGTSKYVECHYVIDGKPSHLVTFVQEALIDHICSDWSAEDRILILCTDEAESKNWNDGGNFEKGLESRLKTANLRPSIYRVKIPSGQNEEEIMQIFLRTMDWLRDNDKVFLDITHSLRSIPLLMTVILNYAKVVKKITVGGIYYGAFEVLGTPKQVEQLPKEERKAPIFDLTPYDSLLDWAKAVEVFEKAGYAGDLTRLMNKDLGPLFKQKGHPREALDGLSDLKSCLEALWKNLMTARGPEIDRKEPLLPIIDRIEHSPLIPPMSPLFKILKERLKGLDADDPMERSFNAVKWCIEHSMIPQAYALMREAVITALCRAGGYDPFDETRREEFIVAILLLMGKKIPKEGGETRPKINSLEAEQFMNKSDLVGLANAFEPLRKYRNDLMHAGWKMDRSSADSLINRAVKYQKQLTKAWEKFKASRADFKRHAFVILSHQLTSDQTEELSSRWAAEEIVYLPEDLSQTWGNLSPEAETIEEVISPIQEWLKQCSYPGDIVVVQGEHGATLKVALFSHSIGLVPVYATTRRVLEEIKLQDGSIQQERVFKHVRFRRFF